jgi:hypothetical protein
MGLPASLVAELEQAGETAARGFEVWPDNMPVVDAFCAVTTQWRATALADGSVLWLGLDYTAVRARLGEVSDRIWRGLAVMERAATAALNGERG